MGVSGLTTYVQQYSDILFKEHKLKNTLIIIDGYALAYGLHTGCNEAFGGDYDFYSKRVLKFFELLEKCMVTPVVVCDGGYEKRKFRTIIKRSSDKVYSLERVTPALDTRSCFPLMMCHVFREILLSKNIALLQSDFEADCEIAALAKKVLAPVLSNDSDFFIYDVQYIPFSSVSLNSCEKDTNGEFYIPCDIFHMDNLLKGFGGLPKTMLPLLATVLGNDYIKASQFKNFYSQLKKDNDKKTQPGHKRVKGVVAWLRNENFDSALKKILGSLRKCQRKRVLRNIKDVMKVYTNLNTPLDRYLPKDIQSKLETRNSAIQLTGEFCKLSCIDNITSDSEIEEKLSDFANVSELEGSSSDECNDGEEEMVEEDDEESLDESVSNKRLPSWLLEESRRGNLHSTINTILSLRTYFFDPQVEDYSLSHAGSTALPILQTLMGLLGIDSITYYARIKNHYVGTPLHSMPSRISNGQEIIGLTILEKKKLIFDTLKIEKSEYLENFPKKWHLYIMSIVFWLKSCSELYILPCHIHALLITLITVGVICSKIGIFQHRKTFLKKYGGRLHALDKTQNMVLPIISQTDSIESIINRVSIDECIIAMDLLLPFLRTDERLKRNPKNFSRCTIHLFAQLQYSYHFAVNLNSLLLMPFKRSNLSMFYNGTLLYNFSVNLKNRCNILLYINNFFSKEPVIQFLYHKLYNDFCDLTTAIPKQNLKVKKPKRCRKKEITLTDNLHKNFNEEDNEEFDDRNNKFSILTKINQW